jgi:enoyl-CoA hydratase/carnithine racemase
MTGQLFDAATMREWGVVTRLWPDDEFEAKARRFAERVADGPTVAHAATKQIVKAQKEGGARAADAIVPELAGNLFGTEDLQNAVASFLEKGPGHATYEGR